MIKLGIGIVHVSSRPERVDALAKCMARIDRDHRAFGALAVGDDPEMLGVLQNAMWLWRQMLTIPELTHVTILGDDYLPCNGYVDVMERLLTANPDHLVSTYPVHQDAKALFERGISWYASLDGAQTTTLPVPLLRDMVRFYDEDFRDDGSEVNDDTLMNLYAYATGRRIFTSTIATVEQQGVPSLLGHGDPQPSHRPLADMSQVTFNDQGADMGRLVNGTHMRVLSSVKQSSWGKYDLWLRAWVGQPGYTYGMDLDDYPDTIEA